MPNLRLSAPRLQSLCQHKDRSRSGTDYDTALYSPEPDFEIQIEPDINQKPEVLNRINLIVQVRVRFQVESGELRFFQTVVEVEVNMIKL